jgi:hypothetical protein
MTIAVAVLGDTYGIIGADGRVLGNDGGIIDDSRDKTLSLPDPLVIGAHAGLMEIAGTPVTTHLGQLSNPAGSDHLQSTLTSYIAQIEQAVQILPPQEVDFPHRILDFLFVGRDGRTPSTLELYGGRIARTPANPQQLVHTIPPFGPYALIGDDSAQLAAKAVLIKAPVLNRLKRLVVSELVRAALRAGIAASGRDPRQQIQRSGGRVCLRSIP